MTDAPPLAPRPRLHALIPCAGQGSRARTAVPKQYQPLAGRPLVMHTLGAFAAVPRLASVLVAVAPGDSALDTLGAPFSIAHCGGETRAATVCNGLRELRGRGAALDDWVLVHDAARCLVTPALVDRLIDACLGDEVGGLLAQPLADTLKHGPQGRSQATLPREGRWLAQTPQMFRLGVLARALERAGDGVTDEASAIEAMGLQPLLVAGSPQNFKLTWPDDFALAEALLRSRQA
ncbi:2-C-methyl-D-erythritol 4-phosphate cytidylyltransferase [Ramlibacter tataouinensis]|nr:2-C-methyl-D-erythritol 4-phosphate cytidylyltransferase [Ramlibacter tataouinensis]